MTTESSISSGGLIMMMDPTGDASRSWLEVGDVITSRLMSQSASPGKTSSTSGSSSSPDSSTEDS